MRRLVIAYSRTILMALLLTACSRQPAIDVADYTGRLARSLDQSLAALSKPPPMLFPRQRLLATDFDDTTLDLIEYLRLSDCALQQVVAQRNSSLGRVALPSQSLVQDLNFLAVAQVCVELLRTRNTPLAEKLETAINIKARELPARVFQATLAGQEFRAFWESKPQVVVADAETIAALRRLNTMTRGWLAGDYAVDATGLEVALATIRQGQGGAQLLAWQQIASELMPATEMLKRRFEAKPLCYPDRQSAQAEIFRNVVTRYFVTGIQTEIAVLSRASFDVWQQIEALEMQLVAAQPAAYRQWRQARDTVVKQGRQSVTAHVAALNPLMQQCGFLPG